MSGGMGGMMGGAGGAGMMGGNPYMKLVEGATKLGDGQSGGSGGGGGKGNGMLGKIGARSNMPKEAIMGLASGGIQQLQAFKLKQKADAAAPPNIDPRQAAFLSELNQKRKAIDTGADFAAGMQSIDTTNAGTNEQIVRATGGDAGGTIQALLQSQRGADMAKNNVLAQGQQQQMGYNSMYNDLNNRIAGRVLQLQMQRSQQARAEWAQKQQTASQNLMAGVAGLMEQKAGNNAIQTTQTTPSNNTPVTPGGSDENSAFNTGWNFKGKKDTTPATPGQVTPTVMQGKAEMPPPTSVSNLLGKGATLFQAK